MNCVDMYYMTQNSLYIRIIYSIMLIIYNDILYIVYIACDRLYGKA